MDYLDEQQLDTIELIDSHLVDLLKIFKGEPIVINGCFGFGLKEISKSLAGLGYISSLWEADLDEINGFSSIFITQEYDQLAISEGKTLNDYEKMEEIVSYNTTDCQVLIEIINFLRKTYKENV